MTIVVSAQSGVSFPMSHLMLKSSKIPSETPLETNPRRTTPKYPFEESGAGPGNSRLGRPRVGLASSLRLVETIFRGNA